MRIAGFPTLAGFGSALVRTVMPANGRSDAGLPPPDAPGTIGKEVRKPRPVVHPSGPVSLVTAAAANIQRSPEPGGADPETVRRAYSEVRTVEQPRVSRRV